LEEGQEESEGNQIIFGGFSKFVTQRSFVQSFGGFIDHRTTSTHLQQYQMVTGVIVPDICFITTVRLAYYTRET
jgi:hypothetical protein